MSKFRQKPQAARGRPKEVRSPIPDHARKVIAFIDAELDGLEARKKELETRKQDLNKIIEAARDLENRVRAQKLKWQRIHAMVTRPENEKSEKEGDTVTEEEEEETDDGDLT